MAQSIPSREELDYQIDPRTTFNTEGISIILHDMIANWTNNTHEGAYVLYLLNTECNRLASMRPVITVQEFLGL